MRVFDIEKYPEKHNTCLAARARPVLRRLRSGASPPTTRGAGPDGATGWRGGQGQGLDGDVLGGERRGGSMGMRSAQPGRPVLDVRTMDTPS